MAKKNGLSCSNYRFSKTTIVFHFFGPKIILQLSYYRTSGNTAVHELFTNYSCVTHSCALTRWRAAVWQGAEPRTVSAFERLWCEVITMYASHNGVRTVERRSMKRLVVTDHEVRTAKNCSTNQNREV